MRFFRALGRQLFRSALSEAERQARRRARRGRLGGWNKPGRTRRAGSSPADRAKLAHTFTGPLPRLDYAPKRNRAADPGEVVWAWVPYEEDPSRGKDRPVLILAEHEGGFLALQLTSKDHDRDAAQEASQGRFWFDVGSGAWDAQRRPSEARVDRVLWIHRNAIRREGAALDRGIFSQTLQQVRQYRR